MTADPLSIIAALLRLYCDEADGSIHAEHAETVAACRLLAEVGRLVIDRDGGEWVTGRLVETGRRLEIGRAYVLNPDEVLEIALRLYENHDLTGRQFSAWRARYMDDLSYREVAQRLRTDEEYDISWVTAMEDSKYAHQIIVEACNEAEEGRARLGVTLQSGHESYFAPDTTLQGAVRRCRVVRAKKNSLNSIILAVCAQNP